LQIGGFKWSRSSRSSGEPVVSVWMATGFCQSLPKSTTSLDYFHVSPIQRSRTGVAAIRRGLLQSVVK
jgi:hypothetical protein